MSIESSTSVAAPAPKLNAIQLIEQELANFFKQKEAAVKQAEQAIANTHAIDGAIQGAQHLLAKLRQAVAAAEAEAVKLATEAKAEVEKIATEVEDEVRQGIHIVETEAKKL